MTKIDTSTEAVEALLNGVTPGPWVRNGTLRNGVIRYCVQAFDGEVDITFQVDEKEDARFIAATRELVPALLAERDALRAEVVKLRAERNHANDVADAAVDEIERLKARAVTVKPLEWHPIETAPKDQIILVYRPTAPSWGMVAPAKWNSQQHHKKPNPFWEIWLRIGGVTESRAWIPTYWMPYPAPPQADYEARILSAITTRSEAEVWNEAIEAARQLLSDVAENWDCGCDPRVCKCSDLAEQWAIGADEVSGLKRPVKGESRE